MMQASNDEFLIISRVDLPKLEAILARFSPNPGANSSVIYRFDGTIPANLQFAIAQAGVVERRLLDRAHFLLTSDPELQQAAYNEFFDYIAAEYESLIDLDRNVRNIRNLLANLREFIGDLSGKCILDFGCGTGLTYVASKQSIGRLVGVDQSQHMRRIARSRGMEALGLDYLDNAQSTFNGAIASYVLHLVADEVVVRALVRSLKQGGLLIGNHHKGINIDWAERAFHKFGCDVTALSSSASSEHGPNFAYIKR